MKLLEGKKALILGLANNRSLAWGIAKELKDAGAEIGLSYFGEALKKRVLPLGEEIGASFNFELDVGNPEHISNMSKEVLRHWSEVDIVIHSIAFADKDDLKNEFINTSKENFLKTIEISAYSLVEVARELAPILSKDASITTLTYHGSTQVIPGYNVMGVAKATLEACVRYLAYDLGPKGIRVNAISAGPIKTLAASGVSGLREMIKEAGEKAPLKRSVDIQDVGKSALYLSSHLSSGVTGEIVYVDCGLSLIGG